MIAKAEASVLLNILRKLQAMGWGVKVYSSNRGAIVTLRHEHGAEGLAFEHGRLDSRSAAILRDWLEGQIEARGLWRQYCELAHCDWDDVDSPPILREHRPSLLEAAQAVLCVARVAWGEADDPARR